MKKSENGKMVPLWESYAGVRAIKGLEGDARRFYAEKLLVATLTSFAGRYEVLFSYESHAANLYFQPIDAKTGVEGKVTLVKEYPNWKAALIEAIRRTEKEDAEVGGVKLPAKRQPEKWPKILVPAPKAKPAAKAEPAPEPKLTKKQQAALENRARKAKVIVRKAAAAAKEAKAG